VLDMVNQKRYRIVYVSSTGDFYGGAEFSLYNLVTNLDQGLFDPVVLVPFWGDFADRLSSQGVLVIDLKSNRLPGFSFRVLGHYKAYNPFAFVRWFSSLISLKRKSLQALQDMDVDLIHGNSFVGNIFGAMTASELGAPFIAHLREMPPDGKWSGSLFRYMVRRLIIQPSTLCIAISDAVKNSFVTDCDNLSPSIVVRHNPIDVSRFTPSVDKRLRWRLDNGIPQNAFVIGLIGRFVRWKGHLECLEAFHIVRQSTSKDVRLTMVGDITAAYNFYIEEIKQKIKALNLEESVVIIGFQRDVSAVYSGIDILVVPSHAEPLGLVVLEAMAMGKPVVATRVGGPAEIISDGINGFLVDPKEPKSLAYRILELMENPKRAKEIGMRAKETIIRRFGVRQYAQDIMSLYQQILGVK